MTSFDLHAHAEVLAAELQWLQVTLDTRLSLHFGTSEPLYPSIEEVPIPDHTGKESSYTHFLATFQLTAAERLLVILALTPHLRPDLLDAFFSQHPTFNKRFSEVGGRVGNTYAGILPTLQMGLFLLAGHDLKLRLRYWPWLGEEGRLFAARVLKCPVFDADEPDETRGLQVTPEYLEYFMTGREYRPVFGSSFPASRMNSRMQWEDVVLEPAIREQVEEVRDWLTYGAALQKDPELGRQLKPGYKCLFYGPPGTGKTLTASLLGKSAGREVYKVDLAMVQSKYIGETEKNLAHVFDRAAHHDWILFFDEADSLFGARTEVTSANDRFANNSVGYLLQRIEDFPGVVILATNLKDNIDRAFTRRFQSMIRFQLPGAEVRQKILEGAFSQRLPPEDPQRLKAIAEKYEFSGGMAMNAMRKCTLLALKNERSTISSHALEAAIKNELKKEGILLR